MKIASCPTILLLFSFSHLMAQQGISYPSNPSSSWYFLTPTAFGPEPGKTLFQNAMIGAMQYQKTTLSGNTVAMGMVPTLLLGKNYMPVWLSGHHRIKLGGNAKRPFTTLNTGAFFLSLPKEESQQTTEDLSVCYFNFSFGSKEKNFAIGAAYMPTGFGEDVNYQALTLHGITRLGRKSCLITENYVLYSKNGWTPVSISGLRLWKKRSAFDLSVMAMRISANQRPSNKSLWLAIPWLSFHQTLRRDPINWNN